MASMWRTRHEYETKLGGEHLAAFAGMIGLGSFDAAAAQSA
jgi:hypothetical protein